MYTLDLLIYCPASVKAVGWIGVADCRGRCKVGVGAGGAGVAKVYARALTQCKHLVAGEEHVPRLKSQCARRVELPPT